MLDYVNSKDKKRDKKAPPQWFQDSDFGQSVLQQRDKAVQWAGDTFGIQPPTTAGSQTGSPYQQQSEQMKQRVQQGFLQTPMGQTINGYFSQVMKPLESSTDKKQKEYEAELQAIADNARKKMGRQIEGLLK